MGDEALARRWLANRQPAIQAEGDPGVEVRMVELMGGTATTADTITRAHHFVRTLGLTPFLVRKENTGLLFNRVWRAIKKKCLHLVTDGVASHEDVDRAWMIAFGTSTGPFGLVDLVVLNVVRDIELVYARESGKASDAPPPLLLEKIARGELGRKTGQGFYTDPHPIFQSSGWVWGDDAQVVLLGGIGILEVARSFIDEESTMVQTVRRCLPIVVLILVLAGGSASAQKPRTVSAAHGDQAMSILKRMADVLSQTQRFGVTVDTGFDVVQESGQKIEFGETRKILIRRPDRVRVDVTKRDGDTSGFVFDGQEIAVFNNRDRVYATAAKPGTLDDAIVYFLNNLDMRFPLSDLLSSRLVETLAVKVREATYVESVSIAGVPCDHIAFRGDWADGQLWIAQGNSPLPCRLVLTYKHAEGQPQFWAQFGAWDLAPDVSDAQFVFTPPEGAAKIAFASRKPAPTAVRERPGKKGARP